MQRSGRGQWVQTSLLQAQIFMLDFQAARYLMAGEVAAQAGNNHPTGAPTGVFKTQDGHVNVAPTPVMWKRFCKAIKREDLIDHPDYATPKDRAQNRDRLNGVIGEITMTMTSKALVELLNEAGIPCGPIYTIDQTFADPQVRHLQIAQSVNSSALGQINLVGQPVTLSRTPSSLVSGAPEYGEHTDQILGGVRLFCGRRCALSIGGHDLVKCGVKSGVSRPRAGKWGLCDGQSGDRRTQPEYHERGLLKANPPALILPGQQQPRPTYRHLWANSASGPATTIPCPFRTP